MAARKIERCRGARGQMALYNPRTVPVQGPLVDGVSTESSANQVAQELEGVYGFRLREATGCTADVMVSQRKGEFPPVAFMFMLQLINKETPGFTIESTIDRNDGYVGPLQKAEKAFGNIFAVAILPIPQHTELQLLIIRNSLQLKIFQTFSISTAVKLMVSIHAKLAVSVSEKANQLAIQMNNKLLTRNHAMATLQMNFPFLSTDECDMLLDLFGSISAIAQAGAAKLLDVTVLGSPAAHAIEEFFATEYAVE